MLAVWTRWSALLAAAMVLMPSAAAHASAPAAGSNPCTSPPASAPFGANTNRVGVIDLHFFNAGGAPVTYYECLGDRPNRLGQEARVVGTITSLWSATFWRCDRVTRHFAATATLPDGTFVRGTSSTRTKSCAQRFELEVPSRLAPGRRARVRVVDRWRIGGIRTQLCITPPAAKRACRSISFAKAASVATRHFRPASRGRWRVELRVRRYRVRHSVAVGVGNVAPEPALPTVLATGDSTMQGLESHISDILGGEAEVVSDVRPGFAISRANGWQPVAVSQTARLRPKTVVMSIGAAEGFPMTAADRVKHECCDEAWIAEYARRVRNTMITYRREGRARVFWLTIPAPNDPRRAPIFAAVNTAILRAAGGLPGVRVLRMDLLFTPAGYRDIIRYRGRDVRVREADGIHLNVSGTAIAARAVVQALRER